jgi:hypothetical protein
MDTLRLQNRTMIAFLEEALRAQHFGLPAPSLLPQVADAMPAVA